MLQQFLAQLGVLGPNEDFQQIIEISFDAFAQDETVIAGEFAGMVAGPQDQVIRLGDDDQFFVPFKVRNIFLSQRVQMFKSIFIFDHLRR